MTHSNTKVRLVEVGEDRDGQRLDNFLTTQLKGVPKTLIYRIIRKGEVRVNGGRSKPMTKLKTGDSVRIPPVRTGERAEVRVPDWAREKIESAILHRDDHVLALDKPGGMAVHAGSGLGWGVIDVLRQLWPGEYFELAHRIDRETSGCLLVARSGRALKHFTEQFRAGTVDKEYLCLVNGRLPEAVVRVDAPLKKVSAGERRIVEVCVDGKAAVSVFSMLEILPRSSYLRVEILTGRTHQIRAHAKHLGHSLAGDELYSDRKSLEHWRRKGLNRLFLHASRLELDGLNGERLELNSTLPDELRELLNRIHE